MTARLQRLSQEDVITLGGSPDVQAVRLSVGERRNGGAVLAFCNWRGNAFAVGLAPEIARALWQELGRIVERQPRRLEGLIPNPDLYPKPNPPRRRRRARPPERA